MERNAICNRLEHFICGSIYAHDSNEWRAGQYDIHTNNKDSFFDILQTQTPITFSSHAVTHNDCHYRNTPFRAKVFSCVISSSVRDMPSTPMPLCL